ncbi:3'-5' exonuclease [Ichthyobacterium seriolicida]|uniref:DNA polymerase III subunit epsilon n=1 Tax=Ichthyobacterium seriolicida TaxID=242600 RepID=A0A1J1DZ77_9FLAO|nr:3'-5' exonuclease [Ichthyobacterium seriolicida]BAV95218.1 DNA polymerase III subunit epsilon [Ichthyobacterium seriolicida]
MDLNITKPICFFDLETTGTNISKDRIIEISILKILVDSTQESKTWLVNPTVVIPEESIKVHNITNEDVADKPTFKDILPEIKKMIKNSDLCGYNSNKFDIPLLAEEFLRAGEDFSMKNRKSIDVQNIFHKMEQRTLSAAYKFYCKKELSNAHSAQADTQATYEILKSQLDHYPELKNEMDFLSEFSQHNRSVDLAGFIGLDDQDFEIFNFGKYKGLRVLEILEKDKGYFSWIQNSDFPLYTKKILTEIRLKNFNKK